MLPTFHVMCLTVVYFRLSNWRAAVGVVSLIESACSCISIGLLNQLLQFLGKSGKTDSMIKVI